MRFRKQKGFTLMELLVVISVLSFISSITLVSLNTMRSKARDSRRIQDLQQMTKAMELYHAKHQEYPDHASSDGSLNWDGLHDSLDEFVNKNVNDPLYVPGYAPNFQYMISRDKTSYRIRGQLENTNNPILNHSLTGGFIWNESTGPNSCNPAEGYYCIGSGGIWDTNYFFF